LLVAIVCGLRVVGREIISPADSLECLKFSDLKNEKEDLSPIIFKDAYPFSRILRGTWKNLAHWFAVPKLDDQHTRLVTEIPISTRPCESLFPSTPISVQFYTSVLWIKLL